MKKDLKRYIVTRLNEELDRGRSNGAGFVLGAKKISDGTMVWVQVGPTIPCLHQPCDSFAVGTTSLN